MDSTPKEAAEGLVVVRVLGAVLERLVAANENLAILDPGQVTKFHALKAPSIGISQYLERIHKYASCSTECFILALIYIDRMIQGNNFLLTKLNVHRVAITSILLAAKFFDDAYYNNAYYAKVGGVLVSEMNRLEVEFLFRINFSLHVSPELYNKYSAELSAHATGENTFSSTCFIAKETEIGEVQLQGTNCNPPRGNVPSMPHVRVSDCNLNGENYIAHPQPYQDAKHYVAGTPMQITPPPSAPPSNSYWVKNPMNVLADEAHFHPSINEQVTRCNTNPSPEKYQSFMVSHGEYPLYSQPKVYPWEDVVVENKTSQDNHSLVRHVSEHGAFPRCPQSPTYTDVTPSIYVPKYFHDGIFWDMPHPDSAQMINPPNMSGQPRSMSTIPASIFPTDSVDFVRRPSLKSW